MCMQTAANRAAAGRVAGHAGRLLGGGEGGGRGRQALRLRSFPPPGSRHSSRPRWDGGAEEDVFGEAGIPETECLVNTGVS